MVEHHFINNQNFNPCVNFLILYNALFLHPMMKTKMPSSAKSCNWNCQDMHKFHATKAKQKTYNK